MMGLLQHLRGYKSHIINVYLLLAVVHVFLLQSDRYGWQEITKALLMPVLAVWVLASGPFKGRWLLLVALFFCWVGDVLLLYTGRHALFFTGGLAAFLLGHVAYTWLFLKTGIRFGRLSALFAVLLGAAVVALLWLLWPGLGSLRIAVLLYAVIIAVMAVTASARLGKVPVMSFYTVLLGALLFVVSDGLIALHTFYTTITHADTWIMVTYMMAQYLLVQGILWRAEADNL